MSKAEKLFKQMQNNPQDWRIEEIDTVARHFGFGRIEVRAAIRNSTTTNCQKS